jgi:1-acyl-sn-glycerol-3-phosphate acyltransferase
MSRTLQLLFFLLVIHPLRRLLLGLRIQGAEHLPAHGPAVVVANHNSDLDIGVLMSLFPLRALHRVRPVAAADRFALGGLLPRLIARVLGHAIPIERHGGGDASLAPVLAALDAGDIVVLFPEGTRGAPERLGRFRSGIGRLAAARPHVPVIPVALAGLGDALPKDRALPLPRECDVVIGQARHGPQAAPEPLAAAVRALLARRTTAAWAGATGE